MSTATANRQAHFNRGITASTRVKVVIVIAVLVIGVISFLMLSQESTQGRDYARTLICASNARALGVAIALFTQEHNGSLPEKLEDISPYCATNRILFCPSAKDQTNYSYVLTGATNVWGATNTIILLEFEPNHNGRRHVLFDDGRVALKKASEL